MSFLNYSGNISEDPRNSYYDLIGCEINRLNLYSTLKFLNFKENKSEDKKYLYSYRYKACVKTNEEKAQENIKREMNLFYLDKCEGMKKINFPPLLDFSEKIEEARKRDLFEGILAYFTRTVNDTSEYK